MSLLFLIWPISGIVGWIMSLNKLDSIFPGQPSEWENIGSYIMFPVAMVAGPLTWIWYLVNLEEIV